MNRTQLGNQVLRAADSIASKFSNRIVMPSGVSGDRLSFARMYFLSGCYLAGGALASTIKGERPKDLDFFIRSQADFDRLFGRTFERTLGLRLVSEEVEGRPGLLRFRFESTVPNVSVSEQLELLRTRSVLVSSGITYLSENAITIAPNIQIILRFGGEPEAVIDTFDFQHTKAYFESDLTQEVGSGRIVASEATMAAIASNSLIYSRDYATPLAGLVRAMKFMGRGWRMTPQSLLALSVEVGKLDFSNPEVVKDNLRGLYDVPDALLRLLIDRSTENGQLNIERLVNYLGEL